MPQTRVLRACAASCVLRTSEHATWPHAQVTSGNTLRKERDHHGVVGTKTHDCHHFYKLNVGQRIQSSRSPFTSHALRAAKTIARTITTHESDFDVVHCVQLKGTEGTTPPCPSGGRGSVQGPGTTIGGHASGTQPADPKRIFPACSDNEHQGRISLENLIPFYGKKCPCYVLGKNDSSWLRQKKLRNK